MLVVGEWTRARAPFPLTDRHSGSDPHPVRTTVPQREYVLYTKQGYESMACIKSAFQFEKECELGPQIDEDDLNDSKDYQA